MTRGQAFWISFLFVAVVVSGVAVVYAKYMSRALFVELQQLRAENDLAVAEWGRLQLELANKGSLEDVMRIASGRLNMHAPAASDRVVVD